MATREKAAEILEVIEEIVESDRTNKAKVDLIQLMLRGEPVATPAPVPAPVAAAENPAPVAE